MEQQITWTIFTVALNTLFTGLIVAFFVKRLESKINKEDFEYQTKFADSYSKRTKTLETIIQKFVSFESILRELAGVTIVIILTNGRAGNYNADSQNKDLEEKIQDLKEFFRSNRHFLSNDQSEAVNDILVDSHNMLTVVSIVSRDPFMGTVGEGLMEYVPLSVKENEDRYLDLTKPETLLAKLSVEIETYTKSLEKLYRTEV